MIRRLRIFLSSPGDVSATREIAALTIERLAQDYARFFAIEPYLWEYEAMVASGHFQDSIEPPSAFDIVVLIVWSRLGTPLPERTKVREYRGIDGRTPVTGTEWEYEEALKAAQEVGTPDLLVYRSREDARAGGRLSSSSRSSTGSGQGTSPTREPISAPTPSLQAARSLLRCNPLVFPDHSEVEG